MSRAFICAFGLLVADARGAVAAEESVIAWPDGYVVHEDSTSPDGQFGILVAGHELAVDGDPDEFDNFVVNVKTRKVLGKIEGADYFENQNHRGLDVAWAPDSSACVLTYEGRFGYGPIQLLELSGSRFGQTSLSEQINKALKAAAGDEGSGSVWFRFADGKKLLARALTYTGNPKMEDENTRHARFAGTYDRAARKWISSQAKRTNDYDVLLDAYSVRLGENIFVAPNGDQSKVPPEFRGTIVNSEEEKEQHLDEEMNTVYKAVRVLLSPAVFAKVKQDQIAWLKRRDTTAVGQRSGSIIERIKALQEFLWR